jgi:parvulin-like peptidyl-prolyl isomerase
LPGGENAPEAIVMATENLTAEQEREAKALEAKIRVAIDREVTSLARLLASRDDKDLFGKTEFEVRDLVLKIGAKAYEELLREKKTATTDRE